MTFGYHLLAWRRHRDLSQQELASKARILRPYLSRLERNEADPSLSMLSRLAEALGLNVGRLVDELPPNRKLARHKLDSLARDFLRRDRKSRLGEQALRKLRVKLGEEQWYALLKKIEKHAAFQLGSSQ